MSSLKSLAVTFVAALGLAGALGYVLFVAYAIQHTPPFVAGIELFLFIWLLVHFILSDEGDDL